MLAPPPQILCGLGDEGGEPIFSTSSWLQVPTASPHLHLPTYKVPKADEGWHHCAMHIAQVNIGRMKAPLDSSVMAGFVTRLEEINALADGSAGFVWRLQTPEGNATYLRPYEDDRIIFNMSVWESVDALKQYVY